MRINVGDEVRFTGCSDMQVQWGSSDDPRGRLVIDSKYIVSYVEEHSWHTKIGLKDVEGDFPSVCFEVVW